MFWEGHHGFGMARKRAWGHGSSGNDRSRAFASSEKVWLTEFLLHVKYLSGNVDYFQPREPSIKDSSLWTLAHYSAQCSASCHSALVSVRFVTSLMADSRSSCYSWFLDCECCWVTLGYSEVVHGIPFLGFPPLWLALFQTLRLQNKLSSFSAWYRV